MKCAGFWLRMALSLSRDCKTATCPRLRLLATQRTPAKKSWRSFFVALCKQQDAMSGNAVDEILKEARRVEYSQISDELWQEVCVHMNRNFQHERSQNDNESIQNALPMCVSMCEALAAKDKTIAAKDKTIAAKDKTMDKFIARVTIGGLLQNRDNFNIDKSAGTLSNSHVDRKRLPASAEEDYSFLLQDIQSSLPPDVLDLPSGLLALFSTFPRKEEFRKSYGSEADVQHSVQSALDDAVKIANGWFGEQLLETRQEAGLFSNRPDHSIICLQLFHSTPICAVETKQPDDGNSVIHENIWGQVFDYGSFLRVLGHPSPFVVLSTFRKSYLAWDKTVTACNEAKSEDNRFSEDLKRRLKSLTSDDPLRATETPSPLKEQGMTQQPSADEGGRKLSYSGPHESKDLVKLLVNAIFCSIAKIVTRPAVPSLIHDSSFENYVLLLKRREYEFKRVNLKIKSWNAGNGQLFREKEFCLVALLGTGRTSKAFRAVSMKHGIECVVKMYVRKFDEKDNYARISKKQFEKDAQNAVKREKEMYKAIYGITVHTVTLYDHRCLVLPFFRPIEKESHEEALHGIEERLKKDFVVTTETRSVLRPSKRSRTLKYYSFSSSDQRWCHCGYLKNENGEDEVYLFDLADLVLRSDGDHEAYVKEHCDTLRQRTGLSLT